MKITNDTLLGQTILPGDAYVIKPGHHVGKWWNVGSGGPVTDVYSLAGCLHSTLTVTAEN